MIRVVAVLIIICCCCSTSVGTTYWVRTAWIAKKAERVFFPSVRNKANHHQCRSKQTTSRNPELEIVSFKATRPRLRCEIDSLFSVSGGGAESVTESPSELKSLFIFGIGYVATAVALTLLRKGWTIHGTCTDPRKVKSLAEQGIKAYIFDDWNGPMMQPEPLEALAKANCVLSTVPPSLESGEDPVLLGHAAELQWGNSNGALRWVGYLSSTDQRGRLQMLGRGIVLLDLAWQGKEPIETLSETDTSQALRLGLASRASPRVPLPLPLPLPLPRVGDTEGVYGDRGGGWVTEQDEPWPAAPRTKARLRAERSWLRLNEKEGVPVHIFRLAGIYGPGRSALDAVARHNGDIRLAGSDDGTMVSRIHVSDIVSVIEASIERPDPGMILNVADDLPSTRYETLAYGCYLLGFPRQDPDPAEKYLNRRGGGNKRVDNSLMRALLEASGRSLVFPDYRAGLSALQMGDGRPFSPTPDNGDVSIKNARKGQRTRRDQIANADGRVGTEAGELHVANDAAQSMEMLNGLSLQVSRLEESVAEILDLLRSQASTQPQDNSTRQAVLPLPLTRDEDGADAPVLRGEESQIGVVERDCATQDLQQEACPDSSSHPHELIDESSSSNPCLEGDGSAVGASMVGTMDAT